MNCQLAVMNWLRHELNCFAIHLSFAYLNVDIRGNARVKLYLSLVSAELLDVALEHNLALVDGDVVLLFDFLGDLL